MAISNDELLKSINLMAKALTDMQYQNKVNGTNTVSSLEKLNHMLARAATDTGMSPASLNKLLLKFAKSTTAIGDQAKLTQVLNEFNKKVPEYSRLSSLMTPNDFMKFIDRSLEKIKTTPITLNTKENISFISKSIAKANKDYASTGFGKIASDFYKNATKEQLKELKLMRKSIQSGGQINPSNGGVFRGMVMGAMGQISDIVLNNAGFGELPGKMANLLKLVDDYWASNKADLEKEDVERNANLLANSRMAEASYNEIKRTAKESKDVLIEATMQRDDLTASLTESFSNALSKTDLDEKTKQRYEAALAKGTITDGQLSKITSSWKKTLGDEITSEDKEEIKSFRSNILNNINTLKEIGQDVDDATNAYKSELEKENMALITATKARADVDSIMYDEIKGQFSRIDKELSSRKFRGKSSEELNLLKLQLQSEVVGNVSSKYGINASEARGAFADHSKRVAENLSEQGLSSSDINDKMNSGELSEALKYNSKFGNKLSELSSLFKNPSVARRVTPQQIANIKATKTRTNKLKPMSSASSLVASGDDIAASIGLPVGSLDTLSSKTLSSSTTKASESELKNRQDAFEVIRNSEKKSDETAKLLEKVFGKNAEKAVKVEITNWPQSPVGNRQMASVSTNPPSID